MSSRRKNLQNSFKVSDLSCWPRGLRQIRVEPPPCPYTPPSPVGGIPHLLILRLVSTVAGQVLGLLKTQSWIISTQSCRTRRRTPSSSLPAQNARRLHFVLTVAKLSEARLPSVAKTKFLGHPWPAHNVLQDRCQFPFKQFTVGLKSGATAIKISLTAGRFMPVCVRAQADIPESTSRHLCN